MSVMAQGRHSSSRATDKVGRHELSFALRKMVVTATWLVGNTECKMVLNSSRPPDQKKSADSLEIVHMLGLITVGEISRLGRHEIVFL